MDTNNTVPPKDLFCGPDNPVPLDFPENLLVVVVDPPDPHLKVQSEFKEGHIADIITVQAGDNISDKARRSIAVYKSSDPKLKYEFQDGVIAFKSDVAFFYQPHPWPELAKMLSVPCKGLTALITRGKNDKPYAAISSAIRGEKDFLKELDFGFLSPVVALFSSINWNNWNAQNLDSLHRLDMIAKATGDDINNLSGQIYQTKAKHMIRILRERLGLNIGKDNNIDLPLAGLYACIAMAEEVGNLLKSMAAEQAQMRK
jgi:hypothetical protein